MTRTVVILGVGPGLGQAVAERFAAEGCGVALVARSEEYLKEVAAAIRSEGGRAEPVPADVTDPAATAAAFETVRRTLGPVDVLVDCLYSTETEGGDFRETDIDSLRGAWRVETEGVFRCIRQALPDLEGGGTVLLTNSTLSKRGNGDQVARSVARFGLRGLAESLARDLGPDGVHVVHAVIDGWIDKPSLRELAPDRPDERWMDPAEVAATYWELVEQDRSAWTFELDLRGYTDTIDY